MDDDNYVTVGTPFKVLDEDELPPSKRKHIEDETVRDEKGRRRFHGAFTGGFSAGYFNTVGSKEGFEPQQFVSSRAAKTTELRPQRVEDFMDDEDRGQFGIAPQRLQVTRDFEDFSDKRKRRRSPPKGSSGGSSGPIPGSPLLKDIFKPTTSSIGIKLLNRMGWREGQGIGPRLSKKEKKNRTRVYGCSLPPGVSQSHSASSESEEEVESLVLFAPNDVSEVNFKPKDNTHGLGYTGLDPKAYLSGGSTDGGGYSTDVRVGQRRLRIAGKAFGVGALEDEDDEDVYGGEDMSRYDFYLDNPTTKRPSTSDPSSSGQKRTTESWRSRATVFDTLEKVLEGFHLSTEPLPPRIFYPPPRIPPDFVPRRTEGLKAVLPTNFTKKDLCQPERHIGSVFDLISSEDKAKIEAAKQGTILEQAKETNQSATIKSNVSTDAVSSEPTKPMKVAGETIARVSDPKSAALLSKFSKLSQRFQSSRKVIIDGEEVDEGKKHVTQQETVEATETSALKDDFSPAIQVVKPFARDPAKQERFECYKEFFAIGKPELLSSVQPSSMTEWERSYEASEFRRFVAVLAPESGLTSRFTSSGAEGTSSGPGGLTSESAFAIEVPIDIAEDRSDKQKAAEFKMFGKLTHDEFEWHPDPLLCKRFNVPNPFPSSDVVGVPTVSKDARNLFRFLNDPNPPSVTTKQISVEVEKDQNVSTQGEKLLPSTSKASKPIIDSVSGPEEDPPVAEEEPQRPPVNFFKSIFSDSSDSEDKAEEEEQQSKQGVASSSVKTPVSAPNGATLFISVKSVMDAPPQQSGHVELFRTDAEDILERPAARGLFANLDLDAVNRKPEPKLVIPVNAARDDPHSKPSSSSLNQSEGKKDVAKFGVLLPPSGVQTGKNDRNEDKITKSHKEKHQKKIKRDKHRDKKKDKGKKKKEKKRSGKKKSKKGDRTNRASESDSEAWSTEDSDSTPDEELTNRALLEKLKELKKHKR